MEEIVRVSCVRHTYQDSTSVYLCGLDFVVHRGERVVVLGPNGSGKTTLISHIIGLLKPHEGSVTVFGYDPSKEWGKISRRIGVLLQNVEEQIIAPTVLEDIRFGPRNHGYDAATALAMAERVMAELHIEHLRNKVPHYLSGGERRKVALAGALAMEPELLVLDEPLEGLDPRSKEELLAFLNRLHSQRGISLVMTTHDVDAVPVLADSVYMLVHGGGIVRQGTPLDIFTHPEALAASNLEAPVLARLFQRLREEGLEVEVPLTVDAAVRLLSHKLQENRRKGVA